MTFPPTAWRFLPDWGFVTTKFLDRTLPQAQSMAQARQGQLNGAVFEWHPGGQVAAIPGTELSAPNGIEVSADGKTLLWRCSARMSSCGSGAMTMA